MRKILYPFISVFLFLLFSACSPPEEDVVREDTHSEKESVKDLLFAIFSPSKEGVVREEEKVVPVHVMEVMDGDLPIVVESVGRLYPNREIILSAEIGGTVDTYGADLGDRVKKGQTLIQLDQTDYRLALKEAQANLLVAQTQLDAAQKSYDRSRSLLPKKAISSEAFDQREAALNSARASVARVKVVVEIAEERLKKTRISAPFSGLIAARMVEKGQTVAPGQPLMTLADLTPMRVKVYLMESDYIHLDRDDPVSVILEAAPEVPYVGRIDRIGIKADERTNSFDVEILVENPDLSLKAGMTALVRLTTTVIKNTILIPQSTVLYRKDRMEVFVVTNNEKAEARRVELGRTEGSLIQIIKGLRVGDRLVSTGGKFLKPGDKVVIIDSPQAKAQ
jgi:RND family efflux transporter MFP subunit